MCAYVCIFLWNIFQLDDLKSKGRLSVHMGDFSFNEKQKKNVEIDG